VIGQSLFAVGVWFGAFRCAVNAAAEALAGTTRASTRTTGTRSLETDRGWEFSLRDVMRPSEIP
jgi:hypothetical protein